MSWHLSVALYGFGDALDLGLGWMIGDINQLKFLHGIWGSGVIMKTLHLTTAS